MKQNSTNGYRAQRPLAPTWLCDEELRPIWQVNARLLEALAAGTGSMPLPCRLTSDVSERLRDLGEHGRQRLARLPCLLVDGGFQNASQWLDAKVALNQGAIMAAAEGWSKTLVGIELARLTLHLAWYWSRVYADAVQRVLGASKPCAAMIAKLDLLTLTPLADTYCDWFRARWEDRPDLWRSLIAMAQNEAGSLPFSLDVEGLRRFGEWMLRSREVMN